MAWDFLYLCRSSTMTHWGKLYLLNTKQTWEFFCDTYELLWRHDSKGRSKSSKSRIRNGEYQIKVRTDGSKGWRLELLGTGHREWIQIHRAYKTMYIEGCILPIHSKDVRNIQKKISSMGKNKVYKKSRYGTDRLRNGDPALQARSIQLMEKMKERYDKLSQGKKGKATILITTLLPSATPMCVSITSSVGKNGTNLFEDVMTVQNLLSNRSFKGFYYEPTIVGICDQKMIATIELFQKGFMQHPNGRVDPNGLTIKKLNEW